MDKFEYDVCFSFAGEQREYVEETYKYCKSLGLKVFYDKSVEIEIWGKNLIEVFFDTYKKKSNYCVMFISKQYAEKCWTKFEKRTALGRALVSEKEYILPVRFDQTEVIGLNDDIAYINAIDFSPKELAEVILKKVKPNSNNNDKIESDLEIFLTDSLSKNDSLVMKMMNGNFYIYKSANLNTNIYSVVIACLDGYIKIVNIDLFNITDNVLKMDFNMFKSKWIEMVNNINAIE